MTDGLSEGQIVPKRTSASRKKPKYKIAFSTLSIYTALSMKKCEKA